MDSHIIEPSPRPDSPPRMLQVGQMAARLASDCCSARGLCADRRDKLLKLLDTRGQNCTPNNSHAYLTSPVPAMPSAIRLFRTAEGLNTTTRRAEIGAGSLVFGLRPRRSPLSRNVNVPNPEIFTASPASSRSAIASMIESTNSADSRRDRPISLRTASTQIGARHRRHGANSFQLATSVASPPRRSNDGCSRYASPGPSQPASLAAQGRTDCLARRQKPRAYSVPAASAVGATMSRYVPPTPALWLLPLCVAQAATEGLVAGCRTGAVGASRQATEIRGQADHMPAPRGCRSLRHSQFRLFLGDSSRPSFLGNE